jgi:predicted nucleic acid-binding protein
VALTVEANRDPKPRRLDLMIAAIASAHGLPLYTRNAKDLVGLADLLQVVEV